jgi:hypothetical protein
MIDATALGSFSCRRLSIDAHFRRCVWQWQTRESLSVILKFWLGFGL